MTRHYNVRCYTWARQVQQSLLSYLKPKKNNKKHLLRFNKLFKEINMFNEFKEFLSNMKGLERFNWYVLKPIAIILVLVALIIL